MFLKRKVNAQIFIIAHVLRQISWNINLACMLLTDIVCVVVLEVWVANADGLCLPPVGCGPGLVHHRVLYHLYTCLWCLQIYHYSRYLETGKCLGRKKMMTVCIFCKIYVKFIKIVKYFFLYTVKEKRENIFWCLCNFLRSLFRIVSFFTYVYSLFSRKSYGWFDPRWFRIIWCSMEAHTTKTRIQFQWIKRTYLTQLPWRVLFLWKWMEIVTMRDCCIKATRQHSIVRYIVYI